MCFRLVRFIRWLAISCRGEFAVVLQMTAAVWATPFRLHSWHDLAGVVQVLVNGRIACPKDVTVGPKCQKTLSSDHIKTAWLHFVLKFVC